MRWYFGAFLTPSHGDYIDIAIYVGFLFREVHRAGHC